MHRQVFIILLAIALCPLGSEALTREDFLVHSTQDLVKLCSAPGSAPGAASRISQPWSGAAPSMMASARSVTSHSR